jgi:hypothetical protein
MQFVLYTISITHTRDLFFKEVSNVIGGILFVERSHIHIYMRVTRELAR